MDDHEKSVLVDSTTTQIAKELLNVLRKEIETRIPKECGVRFMSAALTFNVVVDLQRENNALITTIFDIPDAQHLVELINELNKDASQQVELLHTKDNKNVN